MREKVASWLSSALCSSSLSSTLEVQPCTLLFIHPSFTSWALTVCLAPPLRSFHRNLKDGKKNVIKVNTDLLFALSDNPYVLLGRRLPTVVHYFKEFFIVKWKYCHTSSLYNESKQLLITKLLILLFRKDVLNWSKATLMMSNECCSFEISILRILKQNVSWLNWMFIGL